jgi:hypothetical protein
MIVATLSCWLILFGRIDTVFKRVQVDDPLIIRIRDLSRLEDDLQQGWCRLTNQLREQLHRYYPQMLHLSAAADDPWVWELIEMAPQPEQISKLHRTPVQKLLRKYRIRRFSADGILAELQTQPLLLAAGTAQAASEVCLLTAWLGLLHQQKVQVAKRIEDVLDQLALGSATVRISTGIVTSKYSAPCRELGES